jgi:hypothetical protein
VLPLGHLDGADAHRAPCPGHPLHGRRHLRAAWHVHQPHPVPPATAAEVPPARP